MYHVYQLLFLWDLSCRRSISLAGWRCNNLGLPLPGCDPLLWSISLFFRRGLAWTLVWDALFSKYFWGGWDSGRIPNLVHHLLGVLVGRMWVFLGRRFSALWTFSRSNVPGLMDLLQIPFSFLWDFQLIGTPFLRIETFLRGDHDACQYSVQFLAHEMASGPLGGSVIVWGWSSEYSCFG